MNITARFISVVLCIFLANGARCDEKPRLTEALVLEQAIKDAIKKAEPAIACIMVSRAVGPQTENLAHPDHVSESYGSGVVIGSGGRILTNYHVVRDATRIFVRLPGGAGSFAQVHAADPRSDLAVLLPERLLSTKPLKLGNGDAVEKGTIVLSLANPFAAGFRDGSPSASWGIISNVRRRVAGSPKEADRARKKLHEFGTLLQTDARLHLGCSGGALIDLNGELVGLTTSLAAVSGGEVPGGFAIPMSAGVRRIIDVLQRGEEVEYGFLGVTFDAAEGQDRTGVRIAGVIRGSPAHKAGLQPGERITAIDGVPIRDYDDLFLTIGMKLAGSKVTLQLASPRKDTEVVLAKYHVPGPVIASNKPAPVGGLRVDHTSILVQPGWSGRYRDVIPEGVVIREVLPGSSADAARLQPDKIILRVNGKPISTPAEFYREMRSGKGPAELVIANGDGQNYTVKVDPR